MKKYKVLFADLDGTLIETASGKTFPEGIWDMKIKFDVLDAIKKLAPDCVFIVSNQGGVEKGFVDEFSISCYQSHTCSKLTCFNHLFITSYKLFITSFYHKISLGSNLLWSYYGIRQC